MDISNKTLAVLVILAILVSLVGLFIGRARIVTVGKAGPTAAGDIQADVMSDIQIAISGGIDLRGDTDLVAGGAAFASDSVFKYVYVAAVGSSRLDISYRANCNLFLYDATGIPKAGGACVPAAEDNYYQMMIVDATGETFNDQDTGLDIGLPLVDQCDGGTLGLDAAVWPGGYNTYQQVHIDATAVDNIGLDCDGNAHEGFKVGVQVQAPPNEPPGDKISTITFVGAACGPPAC